MLYPRRERSVVRLKGDLGTASVKHTSRVLRAALRGTPSVLEVDFSRVTHLSPEAVLPLFLAARGAHGQGTRFAIVRAYGQPATMVRRMGLERYLSAGRSSR
ncbi:STAS domain-containing protein [Streptomyces sp. NPDC042898]|uniref:STAS domain-containing protein n=1 Tax=Streptomyces sp. NPDC042898 TaxID=3154334 RepID=UPI0033DE279E